MCQYRMRDQGWCLRNAGAPPRGQQRHLIRVGVYSKLDHQGCPTCPVHEKLHFFGRASKQFFKIASNHQVGAYSRHGLISEQVLLRRADPDLGVPTLTLISPIDCELRLIVPAEQHRLSGLS